MSDVFQLEVLIEMEAEVKKRYQFPHIFEPGIVRCKERMEFVFISHSITVQANLNDERFISNHQCISVGGTESPIALEVQQFQSKGN